MTAYLVALGFAVTFLLAAMFGAGLGTGLTRAVLVAIAIRVIAPNLVHPCLVSVLDAMARDTQAEQPSNESVEEGSS